MADELERSDENRVDRVGRSGIYPASGPLPSSPAPIRGQGELGHPEERGLQRNWESWPGNSALLAMGRAVIGGYFLYNGINHFLNRKTYTEYARSKDVAAPGVAVLASGAMIALGGLSVLTGMRPKLGASLIAGFLLGVSPKMHNFWSIEDEQQRMQEFVNFTKNMALLGSSFLLAAFPEPWPAALRQKTRGSLMVA